jgi:glycosyltransferase involved in cell wall biosynthesis
MISAIVLTKNEEKNIKDCLETLMWSDEIIVIDDDSTDKTREIAEKLGAKVFVHPLNNDFSVQRNYGLEKAIGEWVLFIDADERVPAALAAEVSSIKYQVSSINGFYLRRKDFLFGKWLEHGETSNIRFLRLAKKGTGRWIRPVHEIWQIDGQLGELKNPLLHFPHQTTEEFLENINFYTDLNAQVFYEQGVKTSYCQIIAYPVGKFIKNYFLKLGFLDGMAGFLHATFMSFHSFLTRAKLFTLWQKK